MKQTSKVLVGLAIILLLIIAGGMWFLYTNLDTLVAGIIEREGTDATQTDVTVGSVSIELGEGSAGLSRLAVANPQGFSDTPAITLEDFAIELDPMAVTEDPLVIRHVTVNGARLLVEQQGARNNLKTILDSLESQASAEPEAGAEGRKLVIDRFEIENAGATLSAPGLDREQSIELPPIVLTDVGRASNGATAAEIAEQLLGPVIEVALERAASQGLGDALRDKLDQAESDAGKALLERLGHPPAGDDDDQNDP